jgi:hypothetical protein
MPWVPVGREGMSLFSRLQLRHSSRGRHLFFYAPTRRHTLWRAGMNAILFMVFVGLYVCASQGWHIQGLIHYLIAVQVNSPVFSSYVIDTV